MYPSSVLLFRYTTTSRTPIWLDNLYYCDSSTSDLRQCTNAVGVHDCNHAEDIILTCARGKIHYVMVKVPVLRKLLALNVVSLRAQPEDKNCSLPWVSEAMVI